MKVIFGTTNKRKIEDLQNISNQFNLGLDILSMDDIGWNLGEIDEIGNTLEENSLIKAQAIYDFCQKEEISYPIITDDAGLFCDALNGEPGIKTARYADEEIALNPTLPKYQCVYKLLEKLDGETNRKATYYCVVTCMMPDKTYFQEMGESQGTIATEVIGEMKRPYFYSVFVLEGSDKPFNQLKPEELSDTYRYSALKKTLKKISNR